MAKQLDLYPELRNMIEDILYRGKRIPFSPEEKFINQRGERQLVEYLEYYRKDKGYMLSFKFNKKKEIGVKELSVGGKTIVEAVV